MGIRLRHWFLWSPELRSHRSRSRLHRMEDQNIDHPAQRGADEDPAVVMTVQASSAQLYTEEFQHIKEAQKIDEELQEMFS